jgi:hypothetical protein
VLDVLGLDGIVFDAEVVLDAVNDIGDDDLGFDEIIVDAKAFGAFFVAVLTECGQHDDLEVAGIRRVAQYVEDVEAADLGHHDVQQNEVRFETEGIGQGLFPVCHASHFKAFSLKTGHIYASEGVVVFDEQDALGVRRHREISRLCRIHTA